MMGFAAAAMVIGSSLPALAASPAKDLSVIYPPIQSNNSSNMIASATAPAGRYAAAPTPNQDATAPRTVAPAGPEVGPSLFRTNGGYRGEGFIAGSSPQIAQQSRRLSMPGISLKVPLY